MPELPSIVVYSDYKSPYAYLAKDLAYALADEVGARLDWYPYTLDIPSYLGSAVLGEDGQVLHAERNAHQWRRVRYSYMDCRREARRRGLTILGTRKIWDSSLAAIGMLFAKRQGEAVFRGYHDRVFDRFWRRELDIENPGVVASVLTEAGAEAGGFPSYLEGEGRAEHDAVQERAHARGVFGVPTFVIGDEIFWGREHLPHIRDRLRGG